ncbi:MAG: MarR family winged helix-turn-helix transcriptional regulator [Eubacteriales bacterium]
MNFSNESNNIGFLLNKASRSIKRKLDGKLSEIGITSQQFAVIRVVFGYDNKDENKLTPALIAEELDFNRPTVTGIIDRLESKDLVCRQVNPDDRRSQIITLTGESRELIPELERLSKETIEEAMSGLTEKQVDNLKDYLNIIIRT